MLLRKLAVTKRRYGACASISEASDRCMPTVRSGRACRACVRASHPTAHRPARVLAYLLCLSAFMRVTEGSLMPESV
ncbi:protein of unknown function [Pararobbsia alpina]